MDKNTYAGYEYLQPNPAETVTVPEQYFVVDHDDGTFIIAKQIQYVPQTEQPKNPEPCPVYDIGTQQFYVDVDNPPALIPVHDQYVLPEGDSSLFTNNYLLQTDFTTNQEHPPTDIPEYKQTSPHITETSNTNAQLLSEKNNENANASLGKTDCTEIILNDDQYHMLEQKGWILLESNDKVFVLNTLGLHDITENSALVQKLRSETDQNTNGTESENFETKQAIVKNENSIVNSERNVFDIEEPSTEFDKFIESEESVDNVPLVIEEPNEKIQSDTKCNNFNDTSTESTEETKDINTEGQDYVIEVFKEPDNKLRISTKLIFKDIPKKIVLGKSTNGKRLIARMVEPKNPVTIYEKIVENQRMNETDLSETQFLSLLQQTLQSYQNTYYSDDISSADSVITQLFKVPTLRKVIVDQNVVITKVKGSKDAVGKYYKSKPTLITGKVILTNDKFVFLHLPNLLHNFFLKTENNEESNSNKNGEKTNDEMPIVHIHITETVGNDNVVRVNVNLTRRQISANSLLENRNLQNEKNYACASCAAIFTTTLELTQHREAQCTETEDDLMIDIDAINEGQQYYTVLNNGKKKTYKCILCSVTFQRFSSCMKHVKSHYIASNKRKLENENNEEQSSQIDKSHFKCKMCPATFFHPSTLSKHIVTKHIKLKSN